MLARNCCRHNTTTHKQNTFHKHTENKKRLNEYDNEKLKDNGNITQNTKDYRVHTEKIYYHVLSHTFWWKRGLSPCHDVLSLLTIGTSATLL